MACSCRWRATESQTAHFKSFYARGQFIKFLAGYKLNCKNTSNLILKYIGNWPWNSFSFSMRRRTFPLCSYTWLVGCYRELPLHPLGTFEEDMLFIGVGWVVSSDCQKCLSVPFYMFLSKCYLNNGDFWFVDIFSFPLILLLLTVHLFEFIFDIMNPIFFHSVHV